jgi:hypothetical protein
MTHEAVAMAWLLGRAAAVSRPGNVVPTTPTLASASDEARKPKRGPLDSRFPRERHSSRSSTALSPWNESVHLPRVGRGADDVLGIVPKQSCPEGSIGIVRLLLFR